MLLREADWAYALVIVWAYVGIASKQSAPAAVWAAILGAAVVAGVIVYVLFWLPNRRDPGPRSAGA